MTHVTIKIDRGNGWQVRSAGGTDATPDQMRATLRDYARQYPHRALIDTPQGMTLLVAVPMHTVLTVGQIADLWLLIRRHGARIEFLT